MGHYNIKWMVRKGNISHCQNTTTITLRRRMRTRPANLLESEPRPKQDGKKKTTWMTGAMEKRLCKVQQSAKHSAMLQAFREV